MAKPTANLGLTKPELSDRPGITIPQLANNFDLIDSALNSHSTQLADIVTNVKRSFGAKGDGITDDTSSIQNAINSMTNGGVVFFPAGVYMVSKLKIPSNITLKGVSASKSIIRLLPGQPANSWAVQNSDFNNGNTNIILETITVDGNAQAYPSDINVTATQFQKVTNLILDHVNITGGLADGFYAYQCNNVVISGSDFSGNGRFQVDESGLNIDTCNGVHLSDSQSNNNGFHGLLLSGTTNAVVSLVASGNGFDGIRMQYGANNNSIIGCRVFTNTQRGLYLNNNSTNNAIFGNNLYNNGFHGVVFNVAPNNTLTGNMIVNNNMNGVVTVATSDNQKGVGNVISGNKSGDLSLASSSNLPPQ